MLEQSRRLLLAEDLQTLTFCLEDALHVIRRARTESKIGRDWAESHMPLAPEPMQGGDIPQDSGVYFLYENLEEIVYVGQSKNLCKRISGHDNRMRRLWRFSEGFSYLTFNPEDLKWMECYYIWRYRPKFNFNGKLHNYKKKNARVEA